MGSIVAILNKSGENAAKTAIEMMKALDTKESKTCGIASPENVIIAQSLGALRESKIDSSITVGYVSSSILPNDKPQPLLLKNATLVFDGRIYPANAEKPDIEIASELLTKDHKDKSAAFVKNTNGDYAFALMKPKKIVAGRDVMGVRPLYYGENAVWVALASNQKALWSIGIRETFSFPPGHVAVVSQAGFRFISVRTISHSRPKQMTMHAAATKLQALLECSVKERTSSLKEVAVAFSGGLDSSIIALLAKNTGIPVILIHVGLEGAAETECARRAAETLELPLYFVAKDDRDVETAIRKVVGIIEEPDPIKLSIGIPFYWTAQKSAQMGCHVMLAGQGADELFGGYRRYLDQYLKRDNGNVQETMFKDIVGMFEANLERDCKICKYFNVELRLPFATHTMSDFALTVPLKLKMEREIGSLRKLVLRQVARNLGLPEFIADRPKKAIQYATGVNEAIKRIAKRDGMSTTEYCRNMFHAVFEGLGN